MNCLTHLLLPTVSGLLLVSTLLSSTASQAAEENYSPYANTKHPRNVYWGDTHLHTTNSMDARTYGVTLDAADAYRFARGDKVSTTSGISAQLARPLDFLVVSDHTDAMGAINKLFEGDPELLKHAELKKMHAALQRGADGIADVAATIFGLVSGEYSGPLVNPTLFRSVWDEYVVTADRFNEPGRFTTIIGYEWTPTRGGDKLHRNVLYRDNAETARKMLPFTANESINPQDLWAWMQRYEDETGGSVLALAHNGNLSWGQMFPVETNPDTGAAIDAQYVATRARWEPLYEVSQIKGDSEAHPFLSPTDEFADFETWDRGNASMEKKTTPQMHQYEYAREALKNGLKLERSLGVNPYRFGMVGSTDSHTALSTADEAYFFGKFVTDEPAAGRMNTALIDMDVPDMWKSWEYSAAGYAAVWAAENTREALWDAMQRREVYATTGPRMTVRFFGGWDFSEDDAQSPSLANIGYTRGVPMGSSLQGTEGRTAPTFLVGARKDPMSGHLDRMQIIKGWLDADGNTHEKIFNVAWSDGHTRLLRKDGTLPAVGNTVNVANATWKNSIGDAELTGVWQDPEFDASQPAVYYARVLEIPTPRWTAYDAKAFGVKPPGDASMVLQERAYTSPIWYTPAASTMNQ